MYLVKLQSEDDWDNYRYSGSITAECLTMLESLVSMKPDKTLKQLDRIAEEFFLDNNTTPVFKGYHGFPGSVCMSVNSQLVHTPPDDRYLKEGDVISFDTGCTYKETITDSALTCIVGEASEKNQSLVDATRDCLDAAIKSISLSSKTGIIGHTIFHTARKKGFKVIERYTGHGISKNQVHSDPPILNKAEPDNGIKFRPGMVLAIEPLLIFNTASTETKIGSDSWTVNSDGISAHFEHSILVKENGIEVLTRRDNGN